MKLYHYTIADRLVKILIDGHLKLTPAENSMYLHENEKRAVWFTSQDTWDKTAFYGYPDAALDNAGRIRITVDTETVLAVPAEAEQHHLGDWESLVWSAMEVDVDYNNWFVCFNEVPLKLIECIELWKDGKWVKIPLKLTNGES